MPKTHLFSSICIAWTLLAAGCVDMGESVDTTESVATTESADTTEGAISDAPFLSGDLVLQQVVAQLGQDPSSTVRLALDRAVNQVGGFGVEPYPSGDCRGEPERLYWNGDAAHLARLGVVAVADLLALEAVTEGPLQTDLLRNAPVRPGDLARVFRILASTESPALVFEAAASLSNNPGTTEDERRALVAFVADLLQTKRFRCAAGALRAPDLEHPPSVDELLVTLRESASRSVRESAAAWYGSAGTLSAAQADAMLADPSYRVRRATGRLFWRGSDVGPARQRELTQWFASVAALNEMRADTLREDYGVREEDSGNWSSLPNGIAARQAEARGQFLGEALASAPPDVDISGFLAEVAETTDVTNLIEDAITAIGRSTVLSAAARQSALLSLYQAAYTASWRDVNPRPRGALFKALVPLLADGAASDADVAARLDQALAWQRRQTNDWPALRAVLVSGSRAERIDALVTLADKPLDDVNSGLAAGLIGLTDVSAAQKAQLLNDVTPSIAGWLVPLAALEAAMDPRAVLARIAALAQAQRMRLAADMLRAYTRAAASLDLSGAEVAQAVTRYAGAVDGYWASQVPAEIAGLLSLLDDARVSDDERAQAWQEILAPASTAPRWFLLIDAPSGGPSMGAIAAIVRPRVVVSASTCWQGHADPATTRDALSFTRLAYIIEPATLEIDPHVVIAQRAAAVRAASQNTEELPDGADAAAIFALRPAWRSAYIAATDPDRAKWEKPAAELVQEVLGITDIEATLYDAAHRLAFARDLRSLPREQLDAVHAHLVQHGTTARARAQYAFALEAMYGTAYDALATRFRDAVDLRWDLGDAARARGEEAALEAILGAAGHDFGMLDSALALSSQVVAGARVSSSFRQGMLEFGLEAERFWGTLGLWSAGPIIEARTTEPDLSFIARADAVHVFGLGSASGNRAFIAKSSTFGSITRDPRMPPATALQIAWNRLALGRFNLRRGLSYIGSGGVSPATITSTVDAVLGIRARDDVDSEEKQALGRALLSVLE
ncbi:hypothetical protein WMF04_07900 [Sorangium sp. So ce260]|uniref:hypothetical protein n=1 Tax=Sorangium sp. So ce260 TaxID=3133291 RepID=UPI003F62369C